MANPIVISSHELFYLWIGKCIKRWASVEHVLFKMCDTCLDSRRRVVAVVFFRTPTLESKITLVSDLLDARFFPHGKRSGQHDPDEMKRWNKLEARLRKHLPLRNFIAHNPMSSRGEKTLPGEKPTFRNPQPAVVQHPADAERKAASIKDVRVDDLDKHYKEVTLLMNDLGKFADELQERLR